MPSMLINAQAVFAGGLFILWLILGILATVFWLWMLIDCLTSSMSPIEKLIWALVIIFLHLLGALIYFIVARSGRRSFAR